MYYNIFIFLSLLAYYDYQSAIVILSVYHTSTHPDNQILCDIIMYSNIHRNIQLYVVIDTIVLFTEYTINYYICIYEYYCITVVVML